MFDKIFPIITLLIGFGINKAYDFFIKRNKIKENVTDFIIEIKRLNTFTDKQIDENNKLINSLKDRIFNTPLLNALIELNTNRLDLYSKKDIVQFIRNNLKESRLNSIDITNVFFSNLDSLKHNFNDIIEQYNIYKKESGQFFCKWNEKVNELIDFYNKKCRELNRKGIKIEDDSFLFKISTQFNFVGMRTPNFKSSEIFSFYDNFVIKAFEISEEHESDARSEEFFSIINAIHLMTIGIEREKEYLTKNLEKINQNLMEVKELFNKQLEKINIM